MLPNFLKTIAGAKLIQRLARIFALGVAAGIYFMAAGNIWDYSAFDSAKLGATGIVLGLVAALLVIYAVKGFISDKDFDSAIYDSVQEMQSKTNKDKEEI